MASTYSPDPSRSHGQHGHLVDLRILLADRNRLFADSLRRRLLLEEDVSMVGVATSAAEASRLLVEETFDVVVAAVDVARQTKSRSMRSVDVPVVVLADDDDHRYVPELFRDHGIMGWVSRNRSSDDLMKTIRTCRRGDACLPREVLMLLTASTSPVDVPQTTRERVLAQLTEREVEVFRLLEEGMGRAEIAAALHLSPNTVRTHVQRILRRLDVHSTLAALALARAG
jgi:DNA-binding NarL/FixJ family response regulator